MAGNFCWDTNGSSWRLCGKSAAESIVWSIRSSFARIEVDHIVLDFWHTYRMTRIGADCKSLLCHGWTGSEGSAGWSSVACEEAGLRAVLVRARLLWEGESSSAASFASRFDVLPVERGKSESRLDCFAMFRQPVVG
jgi:hypothetical protein